MSNNRNLGNIATAITNATSGQVLTSQGSGVATFADAAGGSGVTTYANKTAIDAVSSPSEGDLAFDEDKNVLYIRAGSAWERIQHGGNVGPHFTTTPPSALNIAGVSGTTGTITAVAVDESGFPVTYDWDAISGSTVYNSSSYPDQITNVSENNGVFTITPSTNSSHAGTVKFRAKASDGAQVSTATTDITIVFSVDITTPNSSPFTQAGTNSFIYTAALTSTSGMGFSSTLRTGKFYFEIVMGSQMSGSKPIGIGFVDASTTSAGYNDTGQKILQGWTGNYYPSGASSPAIGTINSTGDIWMLAYDTSTREVWFGANGTWEKNPVTDSGYLIGTSNTSALKLGFSSSSGASTTYNGTIITGSGTLNYSVPTGFEAH